MCESPEVHVYAEKLSEVCVEKLVVAIEFAHCSLSSPPNVLFPLPTTIQTIAPKGRTLKVLFSNKYTLHVLMSHTTTIHQSDTDTAREYGWLASLEFEDGRFITFHDNYGRLDFRLSRCDTLVDFDGPDIMDKSVSTKKLAKNLQKLCAGMDICSALLDQRAVSGFGNILKCESLYRAKVHPVLRVGSMSKEQLTLIMEKARDLAWKIYHLGSFVGTQPETIRRRLLRIYRMNWADTLQTPDGRTTYFDALVQGGGEQRAVGTAMGGIHRRLTEAL